MYVVVLSKQIAKPIIFLQSVLDPFTIKHLYCNICCTDAMFIKEVLTHFKYRKGDMEGKST